VCTQRCCAWAECSAPSLCRGSAALIHIRATQYGLAIKPVQKPAGVEVCFDDCLPRQSWPSCRHHGRICRHVLMQGPSTLQDTLISGVRRQPGRQVGTLLHSRHTLPVCNALLIVTAAISKYADTSCRDFVMSTYRELKQANPKFPILVREAESAQAKLIARYGETARPCGTAALGCMCSLHVLMSSGGPNLRLDLQTLEWRRV
jgi:Mitochondrial ribosomal protein L51 / S25 / CI-B8 domain